MLREKRLPIILPARFRNIFRQIPEMQRTTILAALSCLAFVACGGNEGSGDENVVNVYNWADYIGYETIAKFEAEYGIKVNYDVYDSAEIVDVKLLAGNSGYDVVIHSNSFSARISPAGVYDELDLSRIPNARHLDRQRG